MTSAQAHLEHVNITVSDIDASARLLEAVFGWRVRWRGPAQSGGETIHIGTEADYLAIYQLPGARKDHAFAKGTPLNHVGIVVDDLEATEARVIAFGLTPFNHGNYEPGRRFYFFDANGIEYEVVSYT